MKHTGKDIIKKVIIAAVCVFMCAVSIVGGIPDYPGNDDTFRNLIASGAFGDRYSQFIAHSSFLLGYPVKLLNHFAGGINWYYWLMLGVNLLSVILICECVLAKAGVSFAVLATVLVNAAAARDFYIALQYTKSAYLYIAAGFLLILHAAAGKKRAGIITGTILFCVGAATRKECFLVLLPFLLYYAATGLILDRRHNHRTVPLRALAAAILPAAAVLLILFGTDAVIGRTEPWKSYLSYDSSRALLHDHIHVSYEDAPERLDTIHTDAEDLILFYDWQFGDTDFYTQEWLDTVAEIGKDTQAYGLRLSKDVLITALENMFLTIRHIPAESGLVSILVFVMALELAASGKAGNILLSGSILAAVYAFYWYFACTNRTFWRAEIGVWIGAGMCLVLYILQYRSSQEPHKTFELQDGIQSKRRVRAAIMMTAAFLCVTAFTAQLAYNFVYKKYGQIIPGAADITGKMEKLRQNEDKFYILTDFWVTNDPREITYDRYHDLFSNSCYLGNWIIPTPQGMSSLRDRGMENPMRALTEYDNVYLCADEEMAAKVVRHLSKVYEKEIEMTEIDEEIWGLNIER